MKFPEKMLLKLPAGTLGRIDAVCGNRSDWVRGVIEGALCGDGGVKELDLSVEAVTEGPKGVRAGRWDADKAALLSAMGVGPCLPRKLEERLGWTVQRVDRVSNMLIAEGKVSFSGGVLEVVRG